MSESTVLFDAPGPRGRRVIMVGNVIGGLIVLGGAAIVVHAFAENGQLHGDLWSPLFGADPWANFYVPGLLSTLRAAALSIVLALVFGVLFGMGRLASNRWVRSVCGIVVEFFRAVPVLLMMIFFFYYFAFNEVFQSDYVPLAAVVVSLMLYNGSVVAELVRSGVHGLPRGQREAALAVGLTSGQSLRSIEVPQALSAMLPALLSQLVVVLKDSALGYAIGYTELLQQARRLGAAHGNMLQALLVAAVLFIVVNIALTTLARRVGRRRRRRTPPASGTAVPTGIAGATPDPLLPAPGRL